MTLWRISSGFYLRQAATSRRKGPWRSVSSSAPKPLLDSSYHCASAIWCACWSSKSHAHCVLLLVWSAVLQTLPCLFLLSGGTPRCLIWINTTHPWHSLPYSLPFLSHHVWCSIILCLYLDILFVVCSPLGFYFSLTKSNVRQEKKNISLKLERKGNRSKGAPKKRQKN